jgi:hypothetical protein
MAPAQTVHHHRSTTKVSHKPYKSKHASKSALKDQAKGTYFGILKHLQLYKFLISIQTQAKSKAMSGAVVKHPTNSSRRNSIAETPPAKGRH